VLAPATTEAVLDRLGLSDAPPPDLDGLAATYLAWCRNVPFDNVVKRIHLASGDPAPIPNGTPDAFYLHYLQHGTGGTCWPSSGALFALLDALGFDARRGSAAMADEHSGPIHSHGTVLVRIDGIDYWVDSSMLTETPIPLHRGVESRPITDSVHAVRVEPVDNLWRIHWTNPIMDGMLGCLLLDDDVTEEHYLARYEWSRGTSPFNTAVYATRNEPGRRRSTIAFGKRHDRTATGLSSQPLESDERTRVLVEEYGYSEEIIAALPPDDPAPVRLQV
jgi:N-hydroxyarylamine O-acetyltransferase